MWCTVHTCEMTRLPEANISFLQLNIDAGISNKTNWVHVKSWVILTA